MANITYNDKVQTLPYDPRKFNSEDANQIKAVVNQKADLSQIIDGNQALGAWNASTNTPALTTTPATIGKYYEVSVGGTQSITGVAVTFQAGDKVISNGTVWQHVPFANTTVSKIQDTVNQLVKTATYTLIPSPFATANLYITSAGATASQAGNSVTAMIPISPNYSYLVTDITSSAAGATTQTVVGFYDANSAFIANGSLLVARNLTIPNTGILTTPSNAAFIRISSLTTSTPKLYNVSGTYAQDSNVARLDRIEANQLLEASKTVVNTPYLATNNRIINATTGAEDNGGASAVTDFFPINPSMIFLGINFAAANIRQAVIAVYDANKTYLPTASYILNNNGVLASTGIISFPSNAAFIRLSSLRTANAQLLVISGDYAQQSVNTRITTVENRTTDLENNKVELQLSANRYDRLSPDNIGARIINASGVVFPGNGTSAVSAFVRIKAGETLTFPAYTTVWGGYSGLYDINKNPIAGTFIQSGVISHVAGAYYARFSGQIQLSRPDNVLYIFENSNPLSGYVPYSVSIPKSLIPSDVLATTKNIAVWGDSIANGIGIQMATGAPYEGMAVEGRAQGGETVLDTMARLGILPYIVAPFTIPASVTPVAVSISSSQSYKYNINSSTGDIISEGGDTKLNSYGFLPVSIQGITGTLNFTRNANQTALESVTFTRSVAGSAVAVSQPTVAKPTTVERNKTFVVFMGTNQGWKIDNSQATATFKDADNLVNMYKRIADWIRPTSNDYIFTGFYQTSIVEQLGDTNAKLWWEYFESEMTKAFGIRYLNVREYLMVYGWKDIGVTSLSASDVALINRGQLPMVLKSDSTHINTKATCAVVNKILEKLHYIEVLKDLQKIPIV